MAQSRALAKLAEKLEDGRSLFREKYEAKASYDRNGVLESAVRFTEAAADDPKILGTVEVTVAQADVINRNARLYSKRVYELAVVRCQALVDDGAFLGEVDHPWEGSLDGAAARWTKVWMDGEYVKASGVILRTEGGKQLKGLLDGKVGVKVSTRGYASYVVETRSLGGVDVEISVIGEDYTMEGIDFVLFGSAPAGRVDSNESTKNPEGTVKLTLEQLRLEHAALVAQIETAARVGFVAQADVEVQVTAAKASARTEGVEEGKKEALASEAVVRALAFVTAVEGLVTPPAPVPVTESEKAAAALAAQVTTLTETVTSLKAEKVAAEVAVQQAAAKQAVADKVEECLKGFAHADLIKADLVACPTVEAVQTMFDSKKALIEQTIARAKVGAAGTGVADVKGPDDAPDGADLTEAELAQLKAINHSRRVNEQKHLTPADYSKSLRLKA